MSGKPVLQGPEEDLTTSASSVTHRQVRGSSLLLAGRVLAAVIGFATQVLIVRTLSKDAYGLFAYGLSLVTLFETGMALGLDRALSRFVPIFHERGERDRALGTIVFVVGVVLVLSTVVLLAVLIAPDLLAGTLTDDTAARGVLLVLIVLAPVQALDNLIIGLFAVFDRPRAIFVRRFVLGPGLRLAVVLLVAASGGDVELLVAGYVLAGVVGLALYGGVLVRLLRAMSLLSPRSLRTMQVPYRDLLFFALPLFTTDLVFVMLESIDAILVAHFGDAADVAELRAVQPLARLNQLVLASFGLLFMPAAARLFARHDLGGIAHLYWRTAVWVATLSYPIFLVSFALAGPITVTMFGASYEDSSHVLAVLAVGYFFNAALGFNGLALNVHGLVRPIVLINLGSLVVNVALNLLLIPPFGAVGAAMGTTSTLVLQNILRQLLLAKHTAVPIFDRAALGCYLPMAGGTVFLLLLQLAFDPPLLIGLGMAGVISFAVLLTSARTIDLSESFPEVARLPLLQRLVSRRR